ncbi:MAG TPA: hypothetical protein PLM70_08445 [Bacteroidales bacterium]|nr:hypothetical protein [Bacteroidales bacterium]
MTTIYCTNKLKDFIGSTHLIEVDSSTQNPYGDWNGHLFFYDKRKHLIFVNNKSFYSIIIEDIKKADIKKMDSLFFNRLTEQLVFDKVIDISDTLLILQKLLPFRLASTNNDKKTIGTLNEFVFQYKCNRDSQYWFDKPLIKINSSINDSLTRAGQNKDRQYGRPILDMTEIINTSP